MSIISMHASILSKQGNNPHKLDMRSSAPKLTRRVSCTRLRPRCSASSQPQVDGTRRSGNYQPSLWDFDYIQSLNTHHYKEERQLNREEELIIQVKKVLLGEKMEAVKQLELIDDLKNLGLTYFFQEEIKNILSSIYNEHKFFQNNKVGDLHFTALGFRLLRHHGFDVSQEIFDCFKNEEGSDFEKTLIGEDMKGILQLYEASFLLRQGENTLELARKFSTKYLQKKVDEGIINDDNNLLSWIRHSLDLPLHWRIQRLEARWFLDAYSRRKDMNPLIFELSILDFNNIQATQLEELKEVSRWWNSSCLAEKLPFVRDRIVECYFWALGLFEPHENGYQRKKAAIIITFVTIIDDVYDVYGTLDELQLFTDTIRRWDTDSINQLPYYMQVCYLALYTFCYEAAQLPSPPSLGYPHGGPGRCGTLQPTAPNMTCRPCTPTFKLRVISPFACRVLPRGFEPSTFGIRGTLRLQVMLGAVGCSVPQRPGPPWGSPGSVGLAVGPPRNTFVSEMAYDILQEQGFNSIPYLQKSWVSLVEGFFKEAQWYYKGYTPTLEEYLNNAKISISSSTIISQIYFTLPNSTEKTVIESLYEYHDILCLSGMILRLADDLGTTQFELKRGDVPKAIQCYMKDRNSTEQEAQEHVRFLIREAWKEMNTAMADSDCPFSEELVAAAANLGRAAQYIYLEGDGHGVQHSEIHKQMGGLIFEPYA